MGLCASSGGLGPINPDKVDCSHFEVLKVVGKGGFGKVNAVENRLDGQLYAMKTISKTLILKSESYLKTMWIERKVMSVFKCKSLVSLKYAFHDDQNLYLIMDFMKGGDLRYHLDNHGPLSESHVRFYAAEILLAMEEMNNLNIVYRDLKPDNVLLDEFGHVRVSDFGLCCELKEENKFMAKGEAGTKGYLAPEVLAHRHYNHSQDVWSFAIMIYELFYARRPFKHSEDVLATDVAFPDPPKPDDMYTTVRLKKKLSPDAKDLISKLLVKNPANRLGCGADRWTAVKKHPFFADIDWDKCSSGDLEPPFKPQADVANCSAIFDLEDQFFSENKKIVFTEAQQKKFEGFDFQTEFNRGPISPTQLKKGRVSIQEKQQRVESKE